MILIYIFPILGHYLIHGVSYFIEVHSILQPFDSYLTRFLHLFTSYRLTHINLIEYSYSTIQLSFTIIQGFTRTLLPLLVIILGLVLFIHVLYLIF